MSSPRCINICHPVFFAIWIASLACDCGDLENSRVCLCFSDEVRGPGGMIVGQTAVPQHYSNGFESIRDIMPSMRCYRWREEPIKVLFGLYDMVMYRTAFSIFVGNHTRNRTSPRTQLRSAPVSSACLPTLQSVNDAAIACLLL